MPGDVQSQKPISTWIAVTALMTPDLLVQPPGPRVDHSVHSCGFESCRKQLAYLGLQDTDAEAERSPDEACFCWSWDELGQASSPE